MKDESKEINLSINGKVESSVIVQGSNNTVINNPVIAHENWTTGINKVFQSDIPNLNKLNFQNEDFPIVSSDWSYIFFGSSVFWGYLIVTQFRFISISFKKEVGEEEKIESGIYSSRFISPNFSPLSDEDFQTRHVTQFPLSYITSMQIIECPINEERIVQKKVFRLLFGTPEENDVAFGTRFFLYRHEIVEKIQKTINYYNPKIKFSFHKQPF